MIEHISSNHSIICLVHKEGKPDVIIKQHTDETRFKNEKAAYISLAGESFIPNLLEIKEEEHSITMGRIDAPTLREYVSIQGKIPYSFAKDMRLIESTMAKSGISDPGELTKLEHIFVDDPSKSPKTNGIRVIDFDVCDYVTKDNERFDLFVQEFYLPKVIRDYAFLDDPNDPSWQKYAERLKRSGLSNDIIEDFRKNMER